MGSVTGREKRLCEAGARKGPKKIHTHGRPYYSVDAARGYGSVRTLLLETRPQHKVIQSYLEQPQ
jgi:hypothetical protein